MSIENSMQGCIKTFEDKYGGSSISISAPGRANIIGEHTDYNQGFVLPFAIDRHIHFVAARSEQLNSRIFSVNFQQEIILDGNKKHKGFGGFLNSCLQVILDENREIGSFDLVFGGDLPIGGGMSSSSAMCCGFVAIVSHLFNLKLSSSDLLRIVIRAEKGVSIDGGIMDQYSIINGKKDCAILLDCLDNSAQYIPLNLGEYCFCLIDSGVSHNLQETAYDHRVRTCRSGLKTLQKIDSDISSFRDIKSDHLLHLPEIERTRLRHVLEENKRVIHAVECLKLNDFESLGRLLDESHLSLRDDYEVSCIELDLIVELLENEDGSLGARMMGGGFGGSVISLMRLDQVDEIMSRVSKKYNDATGINLVFHNVRSSDGISESI